MEYIGGFQIVIRLVKPALIPFFHTKLRFSCVFCLFLSCKGATDRPIWVYFYTLRLKGWWRRQSWVKAGKLTFLGDRKTRSSDLLIVVCPLFFSVALLCGPELCFHSLQFWWLFFGDFSPKAEQHVACSKDGNIPLNICRFTQCACVFYALIPISALFWLRWILSKHCESRFINSYSIDLGMISC